MKKNIKQFFICFIFVVVIFTLIVKSVYLSEFNQENHIRNERESASIAQVSLLVTSMDVSERQELSSFLQQLNQVSGITAWQLLDYKNKIVSESSGVAGLSSPQYIYFYIGPEKNHLYSLKLYFELAPLGEGSGFVSILLLSTTLVVILTLVLYLIFGWIIKLDNYAKYLLVDTQQMSKPRLKLLANPISQVINQLILHNSLLKKDKLDLTEQIRKTSYVDEVTELGNQLFFKAEFEVRLHSQEESEEGLLVLLGFSEPNEFKNQVLSQETLQCISNVLKSYISGMNHALVARLRGNDFSLLLPNQSRSQINQICKTLIQQLDKSIFDKTPIKEHFVDIGISAYKQGFDYYKVIAEADMALRNSQLQGGNSWFMYGENLVESKVRGRLSWRSFLQRVIEKRQVQLFGQPVCFFDSRQEKSQEIYVRIQDGDDILTAETFLPMAHQCGLAMEFDRQVVDGVIKHCLYSRTDNPLQNYSINLFIPSLLDECFVGWLLGKLSSYPELSRRLTFEINASQVNSNLSRLTDVVSRLTDLGAHWCIEQFGSPDTNFEYLEYLPINSVKLDRKIIRGIHDSKDKQLLFNALMINLRTKNVQIFAVGVEFAEEAEFLKQSGITGAQGYHFAHPVRLNHVESYLKAI